MKNAELRIGLIAGEASGDNLGAGLIRAIRARLPGATFEGVAGPRMEAEGCRAIYPHDRLSIMGVTEVLTRFRELRDMRADLIRHFRENPPAVLIGIDAPEFNLGLEAHLKRVGIRTVHYVSPQVWAWRRGRLRTISRSVDLMLTLFPFEAAFYEEHGVPVRFVGHPMADRIPMESDRGAAREGLGIPSDRPVIAILPGSRISEVKRLSAAFIETARWCLKRRPELRFVVPLAGPMTRQLFQDALDRSPLPNLTISNDSHEAMTAADAILLASGTATLEAMLLKRPMVVAYRMSLPSYWLAKRLLYVDRYSIPNLLAGEALVPEFIQGAISPARMGACLLDYLEHESLAEATHQRFGELHAELRQGADDRAAEAVLGLVSDVGVVGQVRPPGSLPATEGA